VIIRTPGWFERAETAPVSDDHPSVGAGSARVRRMGFRWRPGVEYAPFRLVGRPDPGPPATGSIGWGGGGGVWSDEARRGWGAPTVSGSRGHLDDPVVWFTLARTWSPGETMVAGFAGWSLTLTWPPRQAAAAGPGGLGQPHRPQPAILLGSTPPGQYGEPTPRRYAPSHGAAQLPGRRVARTSRTGSHAAEALRRLGLLGLGLGLGSACCRLRRTGHAGLRDTGTTAPGPGAPTVPAVRRPAGARGRPGCGRALRRARPVSCVRAWAAPSGGTEGCAAGRAREPGADRALLRRGRPVRRRGLTARCVWTLLSAQGGTAALTDPAQAPTALATPRATRCSPT